MQRRAEEAELAHLVQDGAIEVLVPVRLEDPGHQLVLRVGARDVPDVLLVVLELILQTKGIFPAEAALCLFSAHGRSS